MPTAQPGQTWADNDKRARGRMVRVDLIDGTHAVCTITADREDKRPVRGKWNYDRPAGWSPVGLPTRIRLDRFAPTSTGYRLVA